MSLGDLLGRDDLSPDLREAISEAIENAERHERELGERVKELDCLYGISHVMEREDVSLEEILCATLALVPRAWTHSEVAAARVTMEGWEHRTEGFRETPWRQSSDIVVHGSRVGSLDVCYLTQQPDGFEGPFQKEERLLLDAVTERLGRLIERRRADEMLRLLRRQLVMTQEEQRRRFARELHDEVGQVLTAVKLKLHALGVLPGAESLAPRIEESIDSVDDAIRSVRDISLELRPSALDDLGLVEALRWYLERQLRELPLVAHVEAAPIERPLPAEVEIACFRVAQEALTNVLRHARAQEIWVSLDVVEAGLELRVRDDGVGFDSELARRQAAQGNSLGLSGMQERLSLLGGRLEIESSPGSGTEIRATFPAGWDLAGRGVK